MAPSFWQIILVVVLAVLLFGRGKISAMMGDVAKGINAFKRGMKEGAEEEAAERAERKALEQDAKTATIDVAQEKADSAKS